MTHRVWGKARGPVHPRASGGDMPRRLGTYDLWPPNRVNLGSIKSLHCWKFVTAEKGNKYRGVPKGEAGVLKVRKGREARACPRLS